jgi:hypothetical protein
MKLLKVEREIFMSRKRYLLAVRAVKETFNRVKKHRFRKSTNIYRDIQKPRQKPIVGGAPAPRPPATLTAKGNGLWRGEGGWSG